MIVITFGIDSSNDLYLTPQGDIGIKQNLDAMGDIFINKSQTNKGEIIYNTQKGIDFFNTIFSEPCYPDVFQNQLISELEDTQETQSVSGFKQETINGNYTYSVNCQTSYGKITLQG